MVAAASVPSFWERKVPGRLGSLLGMCCWTPSSGAGKEELGPDHGEAGLKFMRN